MNWLFQSYGRSLLWNNPQRLTRGKPNSGLKIGLFLGISIKEFSSSRIVQLTFIHLCILWKSSRSQPFTRFDGFNFYARKIDTNRECFTKFINNMFYMEIWDFIKDTRVFNKQWPTICKNRRKIRVYCCTP